MRSSEGPRGTWADRDAARLVLLEWGLASGGLLLGGLPLRERLQCSEHSRREGPVSSAAFIIFVVHVIFAFD